MSLKVALVGYGRMGKEIDALSESHGCEVTARLDIHNNARSEGIDKATLGEVDVAIDFSVAPALIENLPKLAALGINMVIGTTGWGNQEAAMKKVVADAGIGVVVAANFSVGVNVFQGIVERAASLFSRHEDFGAWIHETHHASKRDAPSGTALALETGVQRSGYEAPIDISSTRVGSMPGTHTVGFDGPFETIALTHTTRSRATFAQGALEAAQWLRGKRGWFTMRDVLALD